jgi:high-affinity Fe2+/Pb2+ permease
MTTLQWVGLAVGCFCSLVCGIGFLRSCSLLESKEDRKIIDGILYLVISSIVLVWVMLQATRIIE